MGVVSNARGPGFECTKEHYLPLYEFGWKGLWMVNGEDPEMHHNAVVQGVKNMLRRTWEKRIFIGGRLNVDLGHRIMLYPICASNRMADCHARNIVEVDVRMLSAECFPSADQLRQFRCFHIFIEAKRRFMFIYRPLVFENVVATEAPINFLSRWNTADLELQLVTEDPPHKHVRGARDSFREVSSIKFKMEFVSSELWGQQLVLNSVAKKQVTSMIGKGDAKGSFQEVSSASFDKGKSKILVDISFIYSLKIYFI
ncbi:hypothetical protein J1N35_017279 [Gossypium stocksii]|uniref:Uncharacterized protein n=1 Tax=Gossypium stocksii TaxID=47602 RepID=A0A9D4A3W9_9ROSI|nr:hypothetical protein J1N35_017279 [Gossypium stocksii]